MSCHIILHQQGLGTIRYGAMNDIEFVLFSLFFFFSSSFFSFFSFFFFFFFFFLLLLLLLLFFLCFSSFPPPLLLSFFPPPLTPSGKSHFSLLFNTPESHLVLIFFFTIFSFVQEKPRSRSRFILIKFFFSGQGFFFFRRGGEGFIGSFLFFVFSNSDLFIFVFHGLTMSHGLIYTSLYYIVSY